MAIEGLPAIVNEKLQRRLRARHAEGFVRIGRERTAAIERPIDQVESAIAPPKRAAVMQLDSGGLARARQAAQDRFSRGMALSRRVTQQRDVFASSTRTSWRVTPRRGTASVAASASASSRLPAAQSVTHIIYQRAGGIGPARPGAVHDVECGVDFAPRHDQAGAQAFDGGAERFEYACDLERDAASRVRPTP